MKEYNKSQVAAGNVNEWMLQKLARAWQSTHGLVADGLIGPDTIQALLNDREDEIEGVDCHPILRAALEVAAEDVGKGEVGGNNSGPYVENLLGLKWDGNNDDDGAWCAAFVSNCLNLGAEKVGEGLPIALSFGAKALYNNMQIKSQTPEVGDVVCWDRGALNDDGTKSWQGHVGLVERVEGNLFFTIEGNVGTFPSKVRRFQYDLENETRLEGFGRLASHVKTDEGAEGSTVETGPKLKRGKKKRSKLSPFEGD